MHPRLKQDVTVINPEGGGSRAGIAAGAGRVTPMAQPDRRIFPKNSQIVLHRASSGETLCQEMAKDWATAQQNDQTTNLVRTCIENDMSSSDIAKEGLSRRTDVQEVERFVAPGQLLELPT